MNQQICTRVALHCEVLPTWPLSTVPSRLCPASLCKGRLGVSLGYPGWCQISPGMNFYHCQTGCGWASETGIKVLWDYEGPDISQRALLGFHSPTQLLVLVSAFRATSGCDSGAPVSSSDQGRLLGTRDQVEEWANNVFVYLCNSYYCLRHYSRSKRHSSRLQKDLTFKKCVP